MTLFDLRGVSMEITIGTKGDSDIHFEAEDIAVSHVPFRTDTYC